MALIGTLRNKMGTWAAVFVFVAIAAFTLNDLLGNNSYLFGNDDVGEIAGHSVSAKEYQAAVDEREQNYILNFGRQPGDREMVRLRQEAWELLILRHAIAKEYDKVGIEVPSEEVKDMVWGRNVDESVKQAFTNPETGQFDKQAVINYLSRLENPPPGNDPQQQQMWQDQRNRWELFQRDLAPGRERIKYESLLLKSQYITAAEAEREYHMQSDVAEVRYLYVPFYAVSDSAAAVSDSDIDAWYSKNKERYKTEEARDLKYVSFSLNASAGDSAAIREDMERMARELKETQDDSAYAAMNSDEQNAFQKYDVSSLPDFITKEQLVNGNVIGPFIDGDRYKVVKITSVEKDTIFSARASHILIKWDNTTDAAKKAAREKARNILKEIKGGASFEAKALEHGTDVTRTRGGDLGWFSSGRMVKPFEDAVFAVSKPGLLNDVVETEYGYHIIKVVNAKDNSAYRVATIERAITPSDETSNEAYRKAEAFAADLSGEEAFDSRAKELGYSVQAAPGLRTSDRRVGNLGDAREMVRWAFNEASVGKVSNVFDLQEAGYAVAILTKKTDKGYKELASVKAEITPLVRKEAQGKIIIDKLKTLEGTLDEIAQKYGPDAQVLSSSDLKMMSNSLPTAGFDPKMVGTMFALESGKRSQPIAGEGGVFIVEVQNKTIAPEMADYSPYKLPLEQGMSGRATFSIAEAIKEFAKIEDKRYKFY